MELKMIQAMDAYYPHVDGVVNVVDNYARTFTKMGDDCTVYVPDCGKYDDALLPYRVLRCKAMATGKELHLPRPELSPGVRRQLLESGADIIHSHTPFMMGRSAYRLAKRLDIPFVTTFHSKYYDDFLAYTGSERVARFGLRYILELYNKADAVWAVNSATAQTLRDYGFKGNITVMANGIHGSYPEDPQQLIRRANSAYPLPCEGFEIVFVGQLIWQKNHRLVLDTAARLKKRGIAFSVTVAGCGDNGEEIKAYARSLGLDDCVKYLGRVTDRELLCGLYLRSKLFFFPSVYDNAPITLQEASLNRVPALLMQGSNASQGIADGVNGWLCDNDPDKTADKIALIMANEENRVRVGLEASRTVVNRWEDIMPAVKEEYIRLIKNKKCGK